MIIQIKEKTQNEQDYLAMVGDLQALRGRVNKIGGITCIVIAVVPNGLGLMFYPLGMVLLKSDKVSMAKIVNKMYYSIVTQYKTMRWRR